MEDNLECEREVKKRKSRISSILKPTFGPLLDLDPNQQTEEYVTPKKKPRRSSSKRVSFARRSEVKEFARDSPHEKWIAPDLHSGQDESTSEKRSDDGVSELSESAHQRSQYDIVFSSSPECSNTSIVRTNTCQPISSGTFQAVVNTTVNKYTGLSLVETDTLSTSSAVSSKGLVSSNLANRQPLGCLTDSVSRIPQSRYDDNLPHEDEQGKVNVDQKTFLRSFFGNASSDYDLPLKVEEEKVVIDQKSFLMSLSGSASSSYKDNETTSPTGLDKGISIDGGAFLRSLASDRPQENTLDLGQEKTMFFDNDMEHTEALTCHIQFNNKGENTGIKRQSFLSSGAGGGSDFFRSGVGGGIVTGQVYNTDDQPTRIFHCADEMEQTEALTGCIQVDKETNSDEGIFFKTIPHVQEDKRISPEKTCIFQDGNDMEETKMLHRAIVLNSGEKSAVDNDRMKTRIIDTSVAVDRTLLFPQGTDMEETKVIQNTIQDGQNLTKGNASLNTNKTLLFPQGTDMEETNVIQNTIQDGQNLTKGNASLNTDQTLLFPQGTDMEETKVIQNTIQDGQNLTKGNASLNTNKTLLFPHGTDMEETKVIQNTIQDGQNLTKGNVSLSTNKTLLFPHGTDMEETKVVQNKIQDCQNLAMRNASLNTNQTLCFTQGTDMEETKVIQNTIQDGQNLTKGNASLNTNKTLLFPQGTDMEETKVVQNTIQDGQNLTKGNASLNTNKTLLFPQGTDMEETKVVQNTIQDGQNLMMGNASLNTNKTLLFPQGTDMEETNVIQNTIQDGQNLTKGNASLNTNKTLLFPQGTDMEETKVVQNKIQDFQNLAMRNASLNTDQTLCFTQGTDMEETKVIQNTIQDGQNLTKGNASLNTNKTLLFPQGTDMEETKVVQNTIQDGQNLTKGNASLNTNKTLLFPHGTDMEETKVVQNTIQDGQNLMMGNASLNTNKTLLFPHGTDMDETKPYTGNISLCSKDRVTKTEIYQHGSEMEATNILHTEFDFNKSDAAAYRTQNLTDGETGVVRGSSVVQKVNTSQIFLDESQGHCVHQEVGKKPLQTADRNVVFQEGKKLEETAVVNEGPLQHKPLPDKTVVHDSRANMKETITYTANKSNIQEEQPKNKTITFHHGGNMDLTKSQESNISNKTNTVGPGVSKTVLFPEGHNMVDTAVSELGVIKGTCDTDNTQVDQKMMSSISPQFKEVDVLKTEDLGKQDGDNLTTCMTTNIAHNSTGMVPEVLEPIRTGDFTRRSMTGPLGLTLLQQARDKKQTPSKNKIRLSTPAKSTENPLDLLSQSVLSRENAQGLSTESSEAQVGSEGLANGNTRGDNSQDLNVTVSNTPGKSKLEDILALDAGIDQILPPDDMLTNLTLQSSMIAGQSDIGRRLGTSIVHSFTSLSNESHVDNNNTVDGVSNYSRAESNQTINSSSSGCSLTDSRMEDMLQEISGTMSVESFCKFLGVGSLRWRSNFQLKGYRCSMPAESVDMSDLKGILQAQTIHHPYYELYSQVYRHATQQAIEKKKECEKLDQVYAEQPPEIFLYTQTCTREQRDVLSANVASLRKTCAHHGNKEWKVLRLGAAKPYLSVLQKNHKDLQHQCEELQIANRDVDIILSDLQQSIEEQEGKEQPKLVISLEEKEQWLTQQRELSHLQSTLQDAETERCQLEMEENRLKKELEEMKAENDSSEDSRKEDLKHELEQLQQDEHRLQKQISIHERCLEWHIEDNERFRMTFYFYKDTFHLELILDHSEDRNMVSAELTSCLPGNASREMKLAHYLIQSAVTEQQILTKYKGNPEQKMSNYYSLMVCKLISEHQSCVQGRKVYFLLELSRVMMEGRCLASEINSISFNNYTSYKESSVCVEFLSLKSLRKVDVTFDLKLIQKGYTVTPHVEIDIGDISCDAILKQLESVPDQELKYFTRLCKAINLDIVDSESAVPS